MEQKEIGRFYAIAFDGTVYDFIVYTDHIVCPKLHADQIKRLVIKPRFQLVELGPEEHTMPVPGDYKEGLIKTYQIDDALFIYLKSKNMIFYSTDMAYLYDLIDKQGFDAREKKTTYKRSKGKILTKQKQGIFN